MKKIYTLAIFIAYIISMTLLLNGSMAGKLYKAIFLPLLVVSDAAFFLLPIVFLLLLSLNIAQFVIKDYKKLDLPIELTTIFFAFGILNYSVEDMLSRVPYFYFTDYFTIDIYVFSFILIILACMYISRKKDTRYYIIPFIFMCLYILYYLYAYRR